jgi:pimeloyl-ACP methyl ester carboxylesterase
MSRLRAANRSQTMCRPRLRARVTQWETDHDGVMTFVLVHGGGFGASCWDLLTPLLDGPVIAVDLPGRGSRPADLSTVGVSDFVDAVVDDLVTHDLHDVILVGHSLAGVTLPGVAGRAPDRVARLVFVSCAVPPHGTSVAEILSTLSPAVAEAAARLGDGMISETGGLHPDLAAVMFCNDMDDAQIDFTLSRMGPEAPGAISQPVDLTGMPAGIPRTYVRLLQDESLTLATQDQMICNLGGAEVIDLDAGHMAMISQPARLADILNAL